MYDDRTQRRLYRDQQRAWRRQRRGFYGGIGSFIWLIVLAFLIFGNHLAWFPIPIFFLIILCVVLIRRAPMSGMGNQMYQPPMYQPPEPSVYQPPVYQPPEPSVYQPPVYQPPEPVYRPYAEGYRPQETVAQSVPQPHEAEQPQPYQYTEQETSQQYEEPLTMYPSE
jgi:hypothetical protein